MDFFNSRVPDTSLGGYLSGPTDVTTNLVDFRITAYNRVDTNTTCFVQIYPAAYPELDAEFMSAVRKALRRRPYIELELRASRAPEYPRAPVAKPARAAVAWPVAIAAYRGRSGTQKASRRLDSRASG